MIANPEKFHLITLTNSRNDTLNLNFNIGNKTIQPEKWVKLLGVKIDNRLNFDEHLKDLCNKASAQLNALCF